MLKEKVKSLVQKKTKGNSKKTLENLIIFLVMLIITVISINIIWKDEDSKNNELQTQDSYKILAEEINNSNISEVQEYNLEKELEDILSKVSGVGKVQVLITYSETSEVIAMHNEVKSTSKTEETDSNRRSKSNRSNRRK